MKNLNLRSWMLFIAFTFIFLGNTAATNYLVSDAGMSECNGLYVETGTMNGKPLYILNNGGPQFAIGWESMMNMWILGELDGEHIMHIYDNMADTPDCPTDGWHGFPDPAPTVAIYGKALAYSSALFTENDANDGSIGNTIGIIYNGFDGDYINAANAEDLYTTGKVTFSNIPVGLTPSMVKTNFNELTFSLTGNATNHATNDRVYNVTVTFLDNAFFQGNASNVGNYNKSNIGVLYKITFSGGAGTAGSPYLISNKGDLQVLSENWGNVNLWDKHYKQTANISFEASDFETGGHFYNNGNGWITIGNFMIKFTGTYNGQNHSISGLYINRTGNDYQGLFGYLYGSESKIENLGVIDVDIFGGYYTGGLVGGLILSTISNCYSVGYVNGYEADISGDYYVGGLVGDLNSGIISNCYSFGNVTGNYGIGGLVGNAYSSIIINSHSAGNVTGGSGCHRFGGLVGNNNGSTISYSYSTSNVIGGNGLDYGGLVGFNLNGLIT